MKILVADKVSDELITKLAALGAVEYKPELTAESLAGATGDASVLIVRSKKVTARTINEATHLSLVIRAGAGVNTIDLKAASNRGIYVANCPGMNTDAVAELVIGLLIAVDRGIADATAALRSGKWQKDRFGKAKGLKGRTLGIVGTGQDRNRGRPAREGAGDGGRGVVSELDAPPRQGDGRRIRGNAQGTGGAVRRGDRAPGIDRGNQRDHRGGVFRGDEEKRDISEHVPRARSWTRPR